MNYLLVAVNGEHKGRSWPVSDLPLTMGRSTECAVVLVTPSISRRHCQVVCRGEQAWLEELGCRNLPLVNGKPVRQHALSPGDNIQLGHDHFILATFSDGFCVGEIPDGTLLQTLNWGRIEAGGDSRKTDKMQPRTVQDLAMLYDAVSEFSSCAAPECLFEVVRRRLLHYFNPGAVWIERYPESLQQDPCSCKESGQGDSDAELFSAKEPRDLMNACLRESHALLERTGVSDASRGELLQFAAPVLFDGKPLAVLAVRTRTGRDVHPEGGLQFLALFARSLAPALLNAEQCAVVSKENERLRLRANESHTIIGGSERMARLREQTLKAANTSITVLITGETGVGKELVARALHDFSSRRESPLVIVNCAAIPRELFENELFGHVKGAFTGADRDVAGLLLKADGGTLFLDEIGDLSLDNQARILRVVENRTFRAIGAATDTKVNIRIVAATNKNLEQAVKQGAFREDLYHRLSGLDIPVPPLREHRGDIPALAEHFLDGFRDEVQQLFRGFAPNVPDALMTRDWPGNVRELRNVIYRAMTLAQGDIILMEDIKEARGANGSLPPEGSPGLSLEDLEKSHIAQILRQCNGNVRLAAKSLGISRSTLYNKINAYGIEEQGFRGA